MCLATVQRAAARLKVWSTTFACLAVVWIVASVDVRTQTVVANVTYPADGSTTADFTRPITWNAVSGAQAYYLYVGTTPGAKDLVNTGEIHQTSFAPSRLPFGQTLYARLWTKTAGSWRYTDSTFAAFIAVITSPPNGSTTADLTQPITWNAVSGAQAYYLYVGTTPGAKDVVNTGEIQQTSFAPSRLPFGQTLYARLWTKLGEVWSYTDSTFGSIMSVITSPADGSTTADFRQPITWTSVSDAGAYYLYVGTTPGANDLVNTGEVQRTSFTASNLPRGQTVYARIWTKIAGTWRYRDSSFSSLIGVITAPGDGSTTANFALPITWTSVAGADAYYLYVGSTAGANDLVNTGVIHQTSFTASNLPTGQMVYARLWTQVAGTWRFSDSSFGAIMAVITAPANGSTTANFTQPITWTGLSAAEAYYLYVGTTVGANDLVNTSEIHQTSFTASNLPAGRMIYARLWTKVAGSWRFSDSSFGSFMAVISTPANGSTIAQFAQPIAWTGVPGAQAYYLYVGSTAGGKDLVDTGEIQQTSFTAPNLPTSRMVYARLWTKIAGTWRSSDSSFGSFMAVLTSPVNGSISANFAQPITWTSVPGAQAYYLYVGTIPGAKDVVDTGEIHQTSVAVHVSTNQLLYARLWTKRNNAWTYTDSVFSSIAAALTYPSDGWPTADMSRPFQWNSVPGADAYYLCVGTSRSGRDVVDTGEVQTTSFVASHVPTGRVLYARLFTKVAGAWRFVDSTFTALPVEPIVHGTDLVYQGSFRVPPLTVPASGNSFDYGGTTPAFNPAHNSLFLGSHVHDQQVAEVGIPAALGTGSVGSLPTASVLQPFADPFEGHRQDIAAGEDDTNTHIGGLLVYDGQLLMNPYVYYGYSAENAHYRRSLDLQAAGTLQGRFVIGPLESDFYTGYMGVIPPEWQSALGGPALIGQCCINNIGRTSYGPSVSAFDPASLGSAPLTASTLVAYPQAHPTLGNWGDPGPNLYFSGTSQITGVVFPAGTSSVLFFGRHGLGAFCYGEDTCPDPESPGKGDHAYPYAYYVWAYDAHDLAAVRAGQKQPWEIMPYAIWQMTLPTGSWTHYIGGAAYDPATGRIFISQQFADGDMPVIHVYTIN